MKPRIVSLLPAATELVCALGARGSLVGRSHECDFPETIRHLPALTAPEVMLTMRPNFRPIMASTVKRISSIGVSMLASRALIQAARSQS